MSSQDTPAREVRVAAENIGGIDSDELTLSPGITVLSGRNATNRTSFLQAIMAGLGSERSSLKGDADEGFVDLEIGEETYTRTLTRHGDQVSYGGDPYLDDPQLADLFAFLLENNEARRAVERGDDLRDLIMRPVDTADIESEITELEREKQRIDSQIDEYERLQSELPSLETERREIETELEEARAEREELQTAIEEADVSLEESRSQKREIEEAFDRLREGRSDLEDLEFELEAERTTLEDLTSERDVLESRLAEAEAADEDPERLAGRIEELRNRQRALNETLSQLGSVISFNEEMLEGDGLDLEEADVAGDGGTGELTDQLVAAEDRTVCWTCGSEVESDRIETTVDRLRELRTEKLSERNELQERINDLTSEKSEIERKERELDRTRRRLSDVETEIETTEERIADLEERIEDQEDRVEELEAETETVGGEYDEVLELHREANELDLRIDRLESDLGDIDDQIEERESAEEQHESLQERREEIADELTELRTRVDRIEEESVESFNDHMASVLEVLEYDNIERIWIERKTRNVREGRQKVTKSTFDLQIVRVAEDGATYRDTIDHLSESEREVIGLVFALAGYLVHEVYEELPVMLLDSLEAIDSDRIARVVDYFEEFADYLVVALLPEDADAVVDAGTSVAEF
ncbi:archaea-specific SMC-related protein [Halopenitus persicus]|uniref:archaea-specific SMC-related protein n=1 Tax=Halopenitus persicus TaxID=1048396 RepID=UPI000BBAD9B0|nr:archaea-specific SMC-related protein [Halopenitus persicus]